jgi:hypothetical protein
VNRVVVMVRMVSLKINRIAVQHKINFGYVRKVIMVIIHGMSFTLMMTSSHNVILIIITRL